MLAFYPHMRQFYKDLESGGLRHELILSVRSALAYLLPLLKSGSARKKSAASLTTMAMSKDRHERIIIMRLEITLHSEAGYIFADCSRQNRFFRSSAADHTYYVNNRHCSRSAVAIFRLVKACYPDFEALPMSASSNCRFPGFVA